MNRQRILTVGVLTGALLIGASAGAAPGGQGGGNGGGNASDKSEADITITFTEDCTGYTATSDKEISHIDETYADGSTNQPEEAEGEHSYTDPQGGPTFEEVSVKSGTTTETEECDPDGGGLPECSDGEDNADPEDELADQDDPGCINDGVYDPNDDDETDEAGPAEEHCRTPEDSLVALLNDNGAGDLTGALMLTEDSIGAQAWDMLLAEIEAAIAQGLLEDPDHDGEVSQAVVDLGETIGTELSAGNAELGNFVIIVFHEGGCIVDVALAPTNPLTPGGVEDLT